MRNIDSATRAALGAVPVSGIKTRNFIWIVGKDSEGDPATWGFWDDIEDVEVSVIDPITGSSTPHDFFGEGSVVEVPRIPLKAALEIDDVSLVLNPTHSTVNAMLRGNDIRQARIDIYRGVYSTDTDLLVSQPRNRFSGKVDTVKIVKPEIGGKSAATLNCVTHVRELTRTNSALKSDAFQQARSGDDFRQYESRKLPVWWGEDKA